MGLLHDTRDRIVGALVGIGLGGEELRSVVEGFEQERVHSMMTRESRDELVKEGLADLELSFEDIGWRDLSSYYGLLRLNRTSLRRIVALSRVMFILNPLIKRAVTVQELYVWGSGCTIKAETPEVNNVLQDCFDDPANACVVGQGEEGWTQREREQRIDGNTFFALFTNRVTGAVRIRLLPYDLVEDIIYNPEDNKEVWFYKRSMVGASGGSFDSDLSGGSSTLPTRGETVLYPDINYTPPVKVRKFDNIKVDWNVRILHVRTGALSNMKWGLPELYASLNWATAYKRILENFATILAAYARIAMKMTGSPGKKGVAAAKSKMNTALNSGQYVDTNAPKNTASWMVMSGNMDVQPIKTSNHTTAPDEARALRSMVASGADLPEHFFGDSDVGNFATSETLDRPTELKMIARQQMWRQVILRLCRYIIESSALAVSGELREANYTALVEKDAFNRRLTRVVVKAPSGKRLRVEVTFPNITERAVADRVRAVVNAATLNGRKAEGIIPDRKFLFKLLLDALGVRDTEALTEKYYPEPVTQGFVDPVDELKVKQDTAKASMISAERPAPTPGSGSADE